jgi:Mrp family chromosome partitioning ATPase
MTLLQIAGAERRSLVRSERRAESMRPWIEAMAVRLANPADGPLFSIGFSACASGEGATTVACAVAHWIQAGLGRRVLLVDANLSTPRLHLEFTVPRAPGLSDLLTARSALHEVVRPVGTVGLHLVTVGASPRDALRAFDSQLIDTMMERLREEFDLVIFDCAPLSGSAETFLLAKRLDGLIMVLAAEKTRWQSGARLIEQLRAGGVNVLGAALNRKKFFIPRALYKRL